MLERIDFYIEAPCVDNEKLSGDHLGEYSKNICKCAQTAQDIQLPFNV